MRTLHRLALVLLAVAAFGLSACDQRGSGGAGAASGARGMSPPASGTSQ